MEWLHLKRAWLCVASDDCRLDMPRRTSHPLPAKDKPIRFKQGLPGKKSSLIFCLLLLALTPGSCLLLQSSLPFTVFSQLGCGDTFVLSSCHLTGQDLLCSGALDLGFYCLTPTEHIWTLSPQLAAILWFFLQYKVCPFQTH